MLFEEKRKDKERKKRLKQLTEIAEAFLKARGVYPRDYEGFFEVAGQRQVNLFYQTMYLCEKSAVQIGYTFDWYYDQVTQEWAFVFTDIGAADGDPQGGFLP